MKLIYVFLFLVGFSASALDRLQTLAQENPTATPYELMKQLYDESTVAAAVTDFDFSTEQPFLQKCALANVNTKREDLISTVIARYGIAIPTFKSRGPLFPDVPGYTKDMNCLFLSGWIDQFNADEMKSVCKDAKLMQNEKDLEWKIKGYFENSPIDIHLRKNADLISFRLIWIENKKQVVNYGYCYREEPPQKK